MKILCIGHVAYDITLPVDSFPVENTKNRVSARMECGGGPASNAAYLLGKWNMDTTFIGILGNDSYGRYIKKEFDDIGVKTDYLQLKDEVKTTSSFIVANTSNGTRTSLTYRPSDLKCDDVELDFEPNIILVDGQEYELSKKMINKYKDAISVIDAGRATKEVIELSKMVDYVVCSFDFAKEVAKMDVNLEKPDTVANMYNKLSKIFKGTIVVTLESKGSLYKYNDEIKIMPSIKVKALDSTGAGDIYHGTFVYGLAMKMDLENIIKISNIAGALSVTKLGGRYSMPTKEEVKGRLYEFK
jgi:sulfofructose kinase